MRTRQNDRLQVESTLPADNVIIAEARSEARREPSYEELWLARPYLEPQIKAPPRPRAPIVVAAVATLIGAIALIALREKIVRVAPPTAIGFSTVGLPVNLDGLELRSVRSRILMDGTRRVLAVEGEIANVRRQPTPVPQLALAVRGDDGRSKYAWTSAAPKTQLEPFEKIPFRARLASPPEGGVDVLVRFASFSI
ncbi:MAG TPA: hypothetical protein VK446_08760 [Methylocystis sp.]|nr:hypothetical protein [Methylocystis sp.]